MPQLQREPTANDFAILTDLIDRARFLDAWDFAQSLKPLEAWNEPEARLLAGRLASYWGNSTLSRKIHEALFRAAPTNLSAVFYAALDRGRRHGPFEAWLFLEDRCPTDNQSPVDPWLARILALRASLLADFHDFEASFHWSDRALAVGPMDAWLWVDRSDIRQKQDDYDGALADLEQALTIQPGYRAAIERTADLLRLRNRDDDARALLQRSLADSQNAFAAQMLTVLECDTGNHAAAWDALTLAERYLPSPDSSQRKWISQNRAQIAYHLGRTDDAIRHAQTLGKNLYYEKFAARLADQTVPSRRVVLPVGFVRQHHLTCAPATMAAIGNFWQTPINHLAVAKVITYDGTPDHEERHWVETNGWVSREFRVTWDAATALIDRGCPFTLTTTYVRSAHLQAVVGYDARLRTLIIRDPYWRSQSELAADEFLASAEANGPRGHVFVPKIKAALLDGLELADETEYDHYYRFRRALTAHQRTDAETHLAALQARNAAHLLSLWARRELAGYDGNAALTLELSHALSARFQNDTNYQLDELASLRLLGRTDELREKLAILATRPGANPLLWRDHVEESRFDARRLTRNLHIARRALRRRPTDGDCLRLCANLLWSQASYARATDVYRLTACVDETKRYHWESYFTAARIAGRTAECLQLLRVRYERLAARSEIPVQNLVDALLRLNRHAEAETVLADALRLRPQDGGLLLFSALQHAHRGQHGDAAALLDRARPHTSHREWLRISAQIGTLALDYARAARDWREILALNPVDAEAHNELAQLIATLHGIGATVNHLLAERAKHPSFLPLLRILIEWQRTGDPRKLLATVDEFLKLAPSDAWAWRERALTLAKLRQFDEALIAANHAIEIEPNSPHSHGAQADVFFWQHRYAESRAALQAALRLHVVTDWLLPTMMQSCETNAERRRALEFFRDEMLFQHVVGDSVTRLQEVARGVVPAEELAGWLAQIETRHADEWQTCAARIALCRERGMNAKALALAEESINRFQSVPEIWLELASCRSALKDTAGERSALERAHQLQPNSATPILRLALVHERDLQLDKAVEICRHGVRAHPLNAVMQTHLADRLWKTGQRDEALAAIERALTLSPADEWAWSLLNEWHTHLRQPLATLEVVARLAAVRPGDPVPWIQKARLLMWRGSWADALEAVDRALKLDRHRGETYDLRAEILAELGQFTEALAACRPESMGHPAPRELRGREAWLEARRGHHAEAVRLMNLLLVEHPDYYWGWSTLAQWHDAKGEQKETLVAANRMTELAPNSPQGWGFIAKAEKAAGNRAAAKGALAEAVRRDPSFLFGCFQLFQMHLEDREIEPAKVVLEAIKQYFGGVQALRCEAELRAIQRDQRETLRIIGELVTVAPHEEFALREAVLAAFRAGWSKEVDELLCRTLADERTSPQAGRLWVESWIERRSLWRLRSLTAPRGSDRWLCVYIAVIGHLGEKQRSWMLRFILWRQGRWLRPHPSAWGEVTYALANNNLSRRVIAWTHDWESRLGVLPWMLLNLTDSLVRKNQYLKARRVLEHGLSLPPDHTTPFLEVWLAFLQMLAGETRRSRELIGRIKPTDLPPFFLYLHGLAEAGLVVQEAPRAKRRIMLLSAKSLIEERRDKCGGSRTDSYLLRLYRRTLRRMGADADDWRTRLKGYVPTGYRIEASATPFQNWWTWWIVFFFLSQIARNCSGSN